MHDFASVKVGEQEECLEISRVCGYIATVTCLMILNDDDDYESV